MNLLKSFLFVFLFVSSAGISQIVTVPSYSSTSCDGALINQYLNTYIQIKWYDHDTNLIAFGEDTVFNLCPGRYYQERLWGGNWTWHTGIILDRDSCRNNDPWMADFAAAGSPTSCNANLIAYAADFGGAWNTEFLWNFGDTTFEVSNLCVGDYWVQVTDWFGCVDTLRATVLGYCPGITASFPQYTIPSGYFNNDGEFMHVVQGMTPPYDYTINKFNLYTWGQLDSTWTIENSYDDTLYFQNMGAAYYQIVIGDSASCIGGGNEIFELGDTLLYNGCPNFQVYANATNETSDGACDGTIDAFASGADGTVSYCLYNFWGDTISTDAYTDSLCPGHYFVYGEDQVGCFWEYEIFVGDSNSIEIDYYIVNEASSPGLCDAEYEFFISGGEPPYLIYHPSSGDSAVYTQSGICPGIHRIDVWDITWSYQGLNYMVVPVNQLYNGLGGGIPLDTLHGEPMERCDIEYDSISSVYILTYTIVDSTITVDWIINYINGSNAIVTNVYTANIDTNETYAFSISIYCSTQKVIENRIKAYSDLSGNHLGLTTNEKIEFNIYPNPSNGDFNISTNEEGEYLVYSTNGKVVKKGILREGDNQIKLNHKGVFLIHFETDKGVLVRRVISQ